MRTNDVILQTVTKMVTFIILAFSLFIFLSGHNAPGGGFIAGLISAAAIVLLLLAFDMETVKTLLPIDFKKMIPLGLMIAILTGVGSFLFGVPFLTHSFGHFDLPLLGDTELATAVLFDIGVYLVVVGVTLTIIQTIGEDE